jgi:hypothetical protein
MEQILEQMRQKVLEEIRKEEEQKFLKLIGKVDVVTFHNDENELRKQLVKLKLEELNARRENIKQ